MKRLACIVVGGCLSLTAVAQLSTTDAVQRNLDEAKIRLEDYNTERLLDSLDQKDLPKLVTGGLFGGANVSNFIITRNHVSMHSHMRVGGELGGFLDFSITQHFAIQPQVLLTAHQNYFAETDTTNRLWSFGAEIPIYFLGRFGNMEKGYIQFGGGLFTHFTWLSNVKDKYQNIEETPTTSSSPHNTVVADTHDYSRLYALHNNHFGICAIVGYEFSFGMQINATYKVSFSDIATFYKEFEGQEVADALIYPQSISLTIGYRWRK